MKSRQGSINQYFKPTSKDVAITSVQNPVKSSPDVIRVEINQQIVIKNPVGRPIKRKQSFFIETDDDGLTEKQVREVKEREDMEANDEFAIQKAKTTSYNSWSDAMKLSLKFHCHIYGKNLKHIGWQTGEYVIDKVKELFPGASEKTIRNKITLEHKGEPDGDIKSLLHEPRPDMNAYFNQIKEESIRLHSKPRWRTYFHGPYKQWIRSEAEQWYQVQFKALIARLDAGGLTLENMDDEIKKLMGLANLRNLAIKWNYAAMQRLSKKDENTDESLISKGWTDKESYGKIFDESFQREAIEKHASAPQSLQQSEVRP